MAYNIKNPKLKEKKVPYRIDKRTTEERIKKWKKEEIALKVVEEKNYSSVD